MIGAWGVLYLGHKIIVGDEGESRCEKRLDDHWLVHSGLARHFLGRRCSRLYTISMYAQIPRIRGTVIAIWSHLDQHQFASS